MDGWMDGYLFWGFFGLFWVFFCISYMYTYIHCLCMQEGGGGGELTGGDAGVEVGHSVLESFGEALGGGDRLLLQTGRREKEAGRGCKADTDVGPVLIHYVIL